MPRQILLIDGDQYLYRACSGVARDVKWDDENHVWAANEVEAWDVLVTSLNGIFDHFNNRDHVIALGEAPYFRHDLHPEYKGGRSVKPLGYLDVKARLREEYKCVSFPRLEADDVMGILATKPGPAEKIIVARDKDMKTLPAKIWDGRTFEVVSEDQADYWHMYQTLTGDVTDGYKGCPGVGPVKARAVLASKPEEGPEVVWPLVVEAYTKAGLTEADALRNARLARILRWSDWDSVNKVPILWTPQGEE
jgi:5'-3' exonuclease